ncbi:ABC transporter transmembrane domain-containing protein [Pseudomaricurvus alkylphenolicus]|uniref:ABC transporter transmembrane domain-containing protein n=1 Tax=Pseudomaricurvus alkylphenolicus TaxID=1306991 RepID=UPI00197E4FC0|nr:ABC transporter transmembrane domain-containing protein [Pseudomaricurvus alkylphenolicus]
METDKPNKKLSVLLHLTGYLRPYKGTLAAAAVALVFTALATLAIGQGVKVLIDQGFVEQSRQQLNLAIAFITALIFAMAIGTFTRFYLVSWLGERVSADIRRAVFDHIIELHPSYFETNKSGEIMSRLTTDTTLLQTIIGSSLSMALRSALTFSGGLIMLMVTNLKLSLIVLGSVPVVLLPILLYGRRVRRLSRESQDSIAHVGSYAGEAIQHIKTVQSYTRESSEKQAFGQEVENAFNVARKRIRQRAILIAVVILLVFGAIAGMLWVGGNDVLSGAMSGGDLGAFVFYAIMVATAVATLSEVFGDLQRAAGATERLLELLNVDSVITAPTQPSKADALAPRLQFRNVTFHYPSAPDRPAIRGLNLNIEAGKSVALVGPSGAGKSTLFELLLRFYDPGSGEIDLDGTDLRQLLPNDLRRQIALVPQQPALFSGSVKRNIAYGREDASFEDIVAAAKAAHAHDFILQLPEGYDSELGEQGVRLSGGQRQRIAIARAILKDPRILLLDEATSALDAESEYHVQQALATLMENRTTLIIAHRLATIQHADSIAVLDQGQLVDIGTHQSLQHSSPLYRRLCELQFSDSIEEALA